MFKFIGRTLAGLVLTKEAKKAVGRLGGPGGKGKARAAQDGARKQAIAEVQARGKDFVTEERAELIRQAMQVRAAKQTILSDLDDETRGKLVAAAMKALLNEGREKG